MACSNSAKDVNNKLFSSNKEGMPTITIAYGAYMNWGRWNHNTGRIQGLENILLEAGYNVQLEHDVKEEGEGWVSIKLDAEVLAMINDLQHNRNSNNRQELLKGLGNKAIKQAKLLLTKK